MILEFSNGGPDARCRALLLQIAELLLTNRAFMEGNIRTQFDSYEVSYSSTDVVFYRSDEEGEELMRVSLPPPR